MPLNPVNAVWEEIVEADDETGEMYAYYYNHETEESVWEPPREWLKQQAREQATPPSQQQQSGLAKKAAKKDAMGTSMLVEDFEYEGEGGDGGGTSKDRYTRVVAYAKSLFKDVDRNKDGWLTKKEVKNYFRAHPAERHKILGDRFTWHGYFTGMDKDDNERFDVQEWVDSVAAAVMEGRRGAGSPVGGALPPPPAMSAAQRRERDAFAAVRGGGGGGGGGRGGAGDGGVSSMGTDLDDESDLLSVDVNELLDDGSTTATATTAAAAAVRAAHATHKFLDDGWGSSDDEQQDTRPNATKVVKAAKAAKKKTTKATKATSKATAKNAAGKRTAVKGASRGKDLTLEQRIQMALGENKDATDAPRKGRASTEGDDVDFV